MKNQVVVKVGLWSLDGTQSTVQSIVQFTSPIDSLESTTLGNPSDNSVHDYWGSGMWLLYWDQVIMKCIQLQNYTALCLCGKRIPDAPFEGLLCPSVCSRLETFTQHMFIFCWITTMQPCLHLEGHVLQSWSKECTREDHWQHPEGTVTENLDS